MSRIKIAAALLLALAAPARASIQYDFVESGTSIVAASLTFSSPPAFSDQRWRTTAAGDILDFRLLDPNLGAVGSYLPTIDEMVVSTDGTSLEGGIVTGFLDTDNSSILVADIAGGPGSSLLIGDSSSVSGDWVLSTLVTTAVPEPSSFCLLAISGLAVLICARPGRDRSRRKNPNK